MMSLFTDSFVDRQSNTGLPVRLSLKQGIEFPDLRFDAWEGVRVGRLPPTPSPTD